MPTNERARVYFRRQHLYRSILFFLLSMGNMVARQCTLYIDLPKEIADFGLTTRSVAVIGLLVFGIIACTYSFLALSYILFFELRGQVCRAYVSDKLKRLKKKSVRE